jgi:hypothetical protein
VQALRTRERSEMIIFLLTLYHQRTYETTLEDTWFLVVGELMFETAMIILYISVGLR